MLAKPIIISSKGQISLPKEVVKHLGNRVLKLEILNNNEVRIAPIKDVGGRLSAYAKNLSEDEFNQAKSDAWEEAIKEKFLKDTCHD